jgi:hypothetical protein
MRKYATLALVCGALGAGAWIGSGALAQAPITFTASTENLTTKDTIKIDLFRWSNDEEKDRMFTAWTQPGSGAGRGKAAAARGPVLTDDPAADDGGGAGAGKGGAKGRGGRGRGGDTPAPAKATPESSLTTALANAPTVGHLWTNAEVAGYSIRYAVRMPQQDGSERVILITDRRLGAFNDAWRPAGNAAASNYDFSVIELHLNAKGDGEGRTSLTGKVAADQASKTLGLENYTGLPVMLKGVKRKTG